MSESSYRKMKVALSSISLLPLCKAQLVGTRKCFLTLEKRLHSTSCHVLVPRNTKKAVLLAVEKLNLLQSYNSCNHCRKNVNSMANTVKRV